MQDDLISRQAVLNTLDRMDKALDTDRTVESYKELLTECYKDLPPVKQEPCEVCINRQDVFDLINDQKDVFYSEGDRSLFESYVSELPPVEQESKAEQFAEWVATYIFDDTLEYNQDAFVELACRKLAKLGIVIRMGDEWELVEPQERSEE